MPIYEIQANGRTFEIESATPPTPEIIQRLMGQSRPATPPPAAATAGMEPPSSIDAPDPNSRAGIIQRVRGTAGRAMSGGIDAGKSVLAEMAGQTQRPEGLRWGSLRPEYEAALNDVEVMATPLAIPTAGTALTTKVAQAVPTRAKAGAKFQQVMSKVGNQSVDMSRPGDAALRIAEMAERGGTMPKVVRDLLKRATDPTKGDISYREMRDFYSNISRLSADEYQRLTPALKMEVGKLRVAMDRAIAATAKAGGQEEAYRAAMKQYALASRIRELSEKALKWGAGLAGAGAAVKVFDELRGR